jgi:hypothetical protein
MPQIGLPPSAPLRTRSCGDAIMLFKEKGFCRDK